MRFDEDLMREMDEVSLLVSSCGSGLTEMRIVGEISETDIALSRSLHRSGFRAWRVVAVLFALLVPATVVNSTGFSNGEFSDMVRPMVKMAIASAALLAFAFVHPRKWRPHEAAGSPIQRFITTDAVLVADGNETLVIPWEYIVRARTSDNGCILYTRLVPGEYIFPRRLFLNDGEWERFREVVDEKTLR